jgi:two-component system OmpR family sensor kinase
MLRSLHARVLLSYLVVIAVCLALVGLLLLVFVRNSPLWTRTVGLRLEAVGRATVPDARQAADTSQERLETLLTRVAQAQETRILLIDNAGIVRYDSDGAWAGGDLPVMARRRILRGDPPIAGMFTVAADERWTYVGDRLPTPDGGRQTVLFVAPPTRPALLAWFAENLLPPLIQAGLVALVLSALLALLISRSVSGPLRRVAGAAQAITRGETDTRARIAGPREVRELAQSFNRMADQVEASQRSQRDFVANVSHELKTPLTSIQGFSQALLDGTAADTEDTSRAARVIHDEADRMRRMVDGLLTLARFDAGQIEMARDRFDLGTLVTACAEKLCPQLASRGVELTLAIPGNLTVTGDRDRLAQVFTNLLDNAVAHTRPGGTVTVTAYPSDPAGAVEVVVADTGDGIPASELLRVFERFYQVDKARRRSRGAGLGLAITKEIVEAHGGVVSGESVVGLGSKFMVRLPVER